MLCTCKSDIWTIHSYHKNFNSIDQAPFVHHLPSWLLPRKSHQFAVGLSWPFSTASDCNLDNTIFTNRVTFGFAPKLYHLAWPATSFIRLNSKWILAGTKNQTHPQRTYKKKEDLPFIEDLKNNFPWKFSKKWTASSEQWLHK